MAETPTSPATPAKETTETTETTETPATDPPAEDAGEEAPAEEESAETTNDVPEFGAEAAADFLEDDEGDDDADSDEPEEGKEAEPKKEEAPAKEPDEKAAEKPEGEEPEGEKPAAPAEEPAPEPTTPAAETPAPEQVEPAPTPPEVVPVVAEPALTSEERTKAYEDWRGKVEGELADGRYAISEEEAEALDITSEAAKAFAKRNASIYMDAVTGAVGHITNALPQLLEAALKTRDGRSAAETEFYVAWPKLNGNKDVVSRLGIAYRKLNPAISKEDFIRDVGAQAMIALKLPAEEVPTTPAKNKTPASSEPFKPAGSAPPGGGPSPSTNVFTKFSDDLDKEEELLDVE